MNLRQIFSWKNLGLAILLIFLIYGCKILWHLHQSQNASDQQLKKYSMFINKYTIERNVGWVNAFDENQSDKYQSIKFQQKGGSLLIGQKFLAAIGHEGQHYQQKTISNVLNLSLSDSSNAYFIIRSQINQQLFYSPVNSSQSSQIKFQRKSYQKLQKCLSLQNIELNDKIHYFIDNSNKFWLISHPHNNILFIQVYDCESNKLIKKIFHEPNINERSFLINELLEIKAENQNTYSIKFLTYQSHEYRLQIIEVNGNYKVSSTGLKPSHIISAQSVKLYHKDQNIEESGSEVNESSIKYNFLDPLNKIFSQEFQILVLSIAKNFMDQINTLLKSIGVSTKTLNAYIRARMRQYEKEKHPEYFDYDVQLVDQTNQCIVNLAYFIQPAYQNDTRINITSVTRLDKYFINTKVPVFHSIENYDRYDAIQLLKHQKQAPVSQFKKLSHLFDKPYQKQYSSNYFYSIYQTQPNNHIYFLGLGEKLFYFYPPENVKQQEYLHIRAKTGGVVLQGNQIKGAYENLPIQKIQVNQKYSIQANQVKNGVFEAHAGYRTLYSILRGNKVELINGLSGKVMLTHHISWKQGNQYAGCYLFNNQWWINQYNTYTQRSQLTKVQLYAESVYPKQINPIKRTYGKFFNSQLTQEEDDVLQVFREFTDFYGAKGFVILDLFRCIDEFYYIQMADIEGKNHAIARIHYKRLSNRQPKKSEKYQTQLEKQLIVQPKDMVKQSQKIDPFLLVLEDIDWFQGIQKIIKQNKIYDANNFSYQTNQHLTTISLLKKLNRFQFLPYSLVSQQKQELIDDSLQSTSTQNISLLNMRVLIENGKKKFMVETRILAQKRLKYFTILFVILILSLTIKLLIRNDLTKIVNDKTGEQKKGAKVQKGKESPQKSKKKQKSK